MANTAQNPQSQGVGSPFPVPAPYNGLNTRENYLRLQPTEARVLENFLPDEGSCNVRPGHALHQSITTPSVPTSVPSLMPYEGATTQQLIAAASNGNIYNVTGAPSSLASGYTVNRWSYVNFNGFLFGVNGTDTPWRYNGTVVSATGFTGPTLTTLDTINQVRNRLWVTQTSSADVRYGPIGGVTGALTTFQLSQIASGGKCIAVGAWSRDGGDGSDDLTVFCMSTGQVIVYQGDPATSFSLIGKYDAPMLVEKGATVKVGGDLVLMTVSGPIPLTVVLNSVDEKNPFSPDSLGNWGKVAPSWKSDYQRYKANPGFNAYFFDGIVYFNFPTGTSKTRQYIYNTRIPAWANYNGMPVAMFADLAGQLYFSSYSDGKIYRHATGTDNGAAITTLSRQGVTYPFQGQRSGAYGSFQPLIDADGPTQVQFAMDTDFLDGNFGEIYDISANATGGDWGNDWGVDWGAPANTVRRWYPSKGYGAAVAPAVRTYSTATNVKWWSSRIRSTRGGQL